MEVGWSEFGKDYTDSLVWEARNPGRCVLGKKVTAAV